jgi:DNA-binding MarR family transcriptional regulator
MKPASRRERGEAPATTQAEAAGPLALGAFLPYRLSVLAHDVSQGLARIYSHRFGIGIPEWRVLAALGENGRMTSKAVGAHAHMHKVKVSRAVASLEARGDLARLRNEDDLREAVLVLTEQGARLYAEIVPLAREYVGRLTAALSAEELNQLGRLLARLEAATAPALDADAP